MSLDLKRLAQRAFDTARRVAPDAFQSATLRMGPSTTVNAATDVATTSWATTATVQTLGYQERDAKPDVQAENRRQIFLVPTDNLPDGAAFDQRAEIQIGTQVWRVLVAELAPGGAVAIFEAVRA
jgi:hypothetical protein